MRALLPTPFEDARRHVEDLKEKIRELERTEQALRTSEARFRRAAYEDALTGLPNVNVYETAMNRMQVESELQGAVERGEFEAFYQAIVDLNSMELAGFESLIRWRHPERGLLGPGEFFSVCEESGMVVPMTTWMLDASCAALARFKSAGRGRKLFVSVNLSARDFGRGDLVERVANALSVSGIRPESLKLEITESAIMENFDNAVAILEDLKKLGVMLSVDDFGTGYSSLSHLHKFPVDTLKVDRSFVSSMEFGSENGEIVRTVITLAKLLGMKIISEGIESLHQLHQLKVLECEYGQGYLFSKPVPEREALEMVEDRHRCFGLAPARATDTMTSVNPDAFVSKDTRTYPN